MSPRNNTETVELPAESIPDSVASGEQTFDEYVEERLGTLGEKALREQMVDNLVANSTEYAESDRTELMRTPKRVLEKMGRTHPAGTAGPSVTANTDDDVEIDDFGTGMIE
ncbi:hypothetical protein [Halococcus agarilyticus]|uniref:hypothetical protein n=1 Tax=Halococcus agarilyticus TaxID=1232219 RepID=UPI000678056B|nr:hypothetical protein [Halococcus agarilyticus]